MPWALAALAAPQLSPALLVASFLSSILSEVAFATIGFGPAILYHISWALLSVAGLGDGDMRVAVGNIVMMEGPTGLVQLLVVWRFRRWRAALHFLWPLPFGVALGSWALFAFGESLWAKRTLGLVFLLVLLIQLFGSKAASESKLELDNPGTAAILLMVGLNLVSGFMRGMFGVAGPAVMVLFLFARLEHSTWRFVSLMQRLTMIALQLTLLGADPQNRSINWSYWPTYLVLMCGSLTGLAIGNRLAPHVRPETFKLWLKLFLASGALLMCSAGSPTLELAASALIGCIVLAGACHTCRAACHARARSAASELPTPLAPGASLISLQPLASECEPPS